MASKKNTDRISNLPDYVLSHLLSFFDTKDSVHRRILSKRWKHLYTLVPVLIFRCPLDIDLDGKIKFLEFVDWVFNSYNVDQMDMFVFSFICHAGNVDCRLPFWISEVVRRGVRKVNVQLQMESNMLLPSCMFTCGTLTYLEIRGSFDLDVPDNVSLPHVETLILSFVTFTDDASASKLLQSLPVLENLKILCFFETYKPVLSVSIPTLKNLEIYVSPQDTDSKFLLEVPNVEYLKIAHSVPHKVSLVQTFKVLRKACIMFDECFDEGYECLREVVTMFCDVPHLCVSPYTLQAFQNSDQSLPMFCNLTCLEIKDCSKFGDDLLVVLDLLSKTPRLEVFIVDIIWLGDDCDENYQQGRLLQKDVPTCVSQHLKEVEFKGFSMLKYEYELVEYILKNAKILEVLKIGTFEDQENQFEISKRLLTFTRCSSACQIVISQDTTET